MSKDAPAIFQPPKHCDSAAGMAEGCLTAGVAADWLRRERAHLPLLLLEAFGAHCYVLVELGLQNSAAIMESRLRQVCQSVIL